MTVAAPALGSTCASHLLLHVLVFVCFVFSRLNLFLLLSGLQAGAVEREARALVGSDVKLGCVYPGESSFSLTDLYVYWQVSGSDTVVAYYLPGNSSTDYVDHRYKSRTRLSLDSMKQGDFSLLLQGVTPQDAQKFRCLVFRESLKLGRILEMEVRLHVAANYSVPVVSRPPHPTQRLVFTCLSTNGYPRPKVYWINKTDNSLLAQDLQNHTVSLNTQGLYDVWSVLTLPPTSSVDVGCCIENELLSQNLTSSSSAAASSGPAERLPESPASRRRREVAVAVFVLLLVPAVVAVVVVLKCTGRCTWPRRSYAGDWAVTLEQELTVLVAHRVGPHPSGQRLPFLSPAGPSWAGDAETWGPTRLLRASIHGTQQAQKCHLWGSGHRLRADSGRRGDNGVTSRAHVCRHPNLRQTPPPARNEQSDHLPPRALSTPEL
ncbi:ICOS ligand [Thomomys bottae]